MKIILTLYLFCFFSIYINAQIGINTENPDATLDIKAQNHNGAVTSTDGVLVPRVNNLGVNGNADGQLVYLITDDITNNYNKGFHYWNATTNSWTPILSVSNSGSGNVATVFKVTENIDFGNFNGSTSSRDETVTGAAIGDSCSCSPSTGFNVGTLWQCFVSAANTITLRLSYLGNGSYNPPAADFYIVVTEF